MKKQMRLLGFLLAAAVLSAGVMAVAAATVGDTGFSDVDSGSWYADAVEYVRENGLMSGITATTFNPEGTTSRGQIAAILYRAAESPAVSGGTDFSDVEETAYYADAIRWASANGVVTGYADGTFRPDAPVTRQQMAAILWRYAGRPAAEAGTDFADESVISDYASTAMDWARSSGLISGRPGNMFDPYGRATRAQTAVILFRYQNGIEAMGDGIVRTTAGLVQGTNENGIYRYLGVPYAQAEERFVPAEEAAPWDGVLVADSYGPMSPQGSISGVGGSGDQSGTDNDCQNLNIWTPGVNDGQARPVMVWLHGGGFSTGSANEAGYDGENLSREGDVVVVSVNHRLNTFGFLDLSVYGDKYQYSANVGMMDIVDALEWIQDNIAAFGGDPDNVTVFGQSGGGAKVLALMSSPYAEGLFDKGIVQSGATETMGVVFNSQEASTALTENILDILGITAGNIEDLQTVPVNELQAAATQALQQTNQELQLPAALGGGYSMDWEPVVDGDFLPTDPVTEDSFAEAGRDIPLLIGSNLNEWSGFFAADPIEETPELEAALRATYPNKPGLTADQVDSTTIRLPLLKIMSHKVDQGGAPVYAYVFTYGNSYHGAEIPYVFDNINGTAEQEALAEQISTAWINFARSGIPSADGLPEWEPYTRESGATLILDTESQLVYHHDQALMELLAPDYTY